MTARWTPDQLQRIGAAEELEIAVQRANGSQGRWTQSGWSVSMTLCTFEPGTEGRTGGSGRLYVPAKPASESQA